MSHHFHRRNTEKDFVPPIDRPLGSRKSLSWSGRCEESRRILHLDYYDDMCDGGLVLSDTERSDRYLRSNLISHSLGGGQHHYTPAAIPEAPYSSGSVERSYHDEVLSSASHATRHARRVYVGNLPMGHTQEDQVKDFLNEVISTCMDEDHTSGYVLSVYMNHKKCYAFVELSTVELTQACLDLDGILYRGSILKIQRANEYKPELLSVSPRAPARFQASKAPFPGKVPGLSLDSGPLGTDSSTSMKYPNRPSSSMLQRGGLHDVSGGMLVVLGFPYDEGDRRSEIAVGAASACRVTRHYLRKVFSSPVNPEYGVDLGRLHVLDIGDVPGGLSLESALSNLDDMVAEIIGRGAVPIIMGGSGDMSYACTAGLIAVRGGGVGVVKVDSRINVEPLVRKL